MTLPRPFFWLARMYFACFLLVTSGYCVLTYVPFTFHQFLKSADMLPWLAIFARLHAYLYWTAFLAAAATLVEDLWRSGSRRLTQVFLGCGLVTGVVLFVYPLLPGLKNDMSSLVWGVATLIPFGWLALIDITGSFENVSWGEPVREERQVFRVTWQAALFLSVLYALVLEIRLRSAPFGLALLGWSLLCHLLICMAVFAGFCLVQALASWSGAPARMEFVLLNGVAALLLFRLFEGLVFPAISFRDWPSEVYSGALALAFTAFLAGLSIRLYRPAEGEACSGLDLQLSILTISRRPSWFLKLVSIPVICVLAYELSTRAAAMDWNYLLQKLSAVAIWTVSFAWLYRFGSSLRGRTSRTLVLLLAPLAVLSAYEIVQYSGPPLGEKAIEEYAAYNPSFRLIRDGLARPRGRASFYRLLARSSNIPSSTRVAPVEVKLASKLVAVPGPKPNIFLFVIDSLRQDYLLPYNSAVRFTPSIDSFARESVVMKNAFTAYGGTGLSEPSIWAGSLLLHKQYVLPFAPMNALAKLVAEEGYENYVSPDTILSTIVAPSLPFTALDKGVPNMKYDLCNSLRDLESKLDLRASHPAFVYTQPQTLHVSVIRREDTGLAAGEQYPGFYAPYAARVRKLDSCFGGFIEFLKAQGIYDNSIVILTSDHGDSLGEEGRWGHAYTIFPEVIRIPLIFHLPERMRMQFTADPDALALLTDITPTLYYLLGHRPIEANPIYGRPLFIAEASEQIPYRRDGYLVASSYAAVYGLLSGNGRRLYIADGVNYRNYLFDLAGGAAGAGLRVSESAQARYEGRIQARIEQVNRFYGFGQNKK